MLELEMAAESLRCHVNTSANCVLLVGHTAACGSGLPLPGINLCPLNTLRKIALGHKHAWAKEWGLDRSDYIAEHITAKGF